MKLRFPLREAEQSASAQKETQYKSARQIETAGEHERRYFAEQELAQWWTHSEQRRRQEPAEMSAGAFT
jgi:hypothetical protein